MFGQQPLSSGPFVQQGGLLSQISIIEGTQFADNSTGFPTFATAIIEAATLADAQSVIVSFNSSILLIYA